MIKTKLKAPVFLFPHKDSPRATIIIEVTETLHTLKEEGDWVYVEHKRSMMAGWIRKTELSKAAQAG